MPVARTALFFLVSAVAGAGLVLGLTRLYGLVGMGCTLCHPSVAIPTGAVAGLLFAVMQLPDRWREAKQELAARHDA